MEAELKNGKTNDSNDETLEKENAKKDKPKDVIKKLKEELKIKEENYLKSVADLENYKKRMNEERIKDRKYAATNLIHDLLLPLDQLSKVVEAEVNDPSLKNYLIGFKMINDQIFQVLEDDGLKEIEALNKVFDPNFHYAVEKVMDKEKEEGIILEVINKGYMYKDRVLRPSMVKVNEWSEEENE